MSDPQSTNLGVYLQTTGSNPGAWGPVLNANDSVLDSVTSNVFVVALTNVNVTLTTPPGSGSAWAGPYGSQSGIIRFTGVLSAAVTVTFPRSGFWIVENLCTVGAFYVALASSAPGKVICAPPGEATHIICDGTDVKYVDLGRVGSYLDLGASAVPAWITNCSVPPYLNCDGTTFNAVTYPVLNTLLGGNTLPDLRGRSRAALNQGTGRITTAGGGVDGNTILAAGGSQTHTLTISEMPAHAHTDSGHTHGVHGSSSPSGTGGGGIVNSPLSGSQPVSYGTTDTGAANIQNTGGGVAHSIMNPVAIGGLTLIRAG